MSGTDDHIQSDSEVSHEEDSAVEDSSDTSPNHPSTSNGPKSVMTNGSRTPTKKPAPPTTPTSDRAHSPLLRRLLSSPGPVNLNEILASPLQASTSRAIFIPPSDAGTSSTNVGSVPGIAPAPGPSTSIIHGGTAETSNTTAGSASVSGPGIAPVPGDLTSIIAEALGSSNTNVGSASASVLGITTASTSIIPGEISNTDVGSVPVTSPLPEAAGASVSAPEDVLRASTSLASDNPEAGEISKTEAVEIPLPMVDATGRGIVSEAEGSNIPGIIPTPEAVAASNIGIQQLEREGIPEIKPALEVKEGNVPGALISTEVASRNVLFAEVVRENKPESMAIVETGSSVPETGVEAARSPDLETVPVVALAALASSESMEAGIPEAVQNIDADVPEILQSTVAHAPSSALPSDAEKAPKDDNILEIVMEASVAQDPVPENAEKSDQLSVSTEAMEIAEQEKCTTAQEESSQTAKECAQSPEQKPVAEKESQALEVTEESKETSNSKTSEATAEAAGQASKLALEASRSPEPKQETSEMYTKLRAALEAKTTSELATIGSGPGQTSKTTEIAIEVSKATEVAIEASKPTKVTIEASKPTEVAIEASKPTAVATEVSKPAEEEREIPKTSEVAIVVTKPTEETWEASKSTEVAIETSKPQQSAETAIEPSRVTEPDEEPMDTSEPDKTPLESKLEPGKVDVKSAERSPVKRPAGGRLEDLKSDDANAPKTPSRRSSRLEALRTPGAQQRTHSESPKPKKERRTVRSTTLERVPSDEKLGVRTRSRRVGSTSSNSEMEGSGDEVKAKRVSRKDSKK